MMRNRTHLLAIGLFFFVCRGAALAEAVRSPEGKPLPDKLQMDVSRSLPKLVWVAYQGLRPTELPGANQRANAACPAFDFMDSACVAGEAYQVGEHEYRLLVKAEGDGDGIASYFGWVDKNYLIETESASQHPATGVYRKAMIVNTVDTIRDDIGSATSGVAVYLGPQAAAARRSGSFRLFTIFFIWGDSDDFVLLGSNPVLDPEAPNDKLRATVLGWVKRDRVCEWYTREAVYWNTANTLPTAKKRRGIENRGRIFESPAQALAALRDESVTPLYTESFANGVSPEPPPDQVRFPVLEWTPDERTPALVPGGQLLKVGAVGDFVNEKGIRVADALALRNYQARLRALRGAVEQTEVLFVIDDTSSMKTWFQAAADSVLRIFRTVRQGSGKLRVAVAFYNDVVGGKGTGVDTMELVDAQARGNQVVARLRSHQPKEGGDPREMVFEGLVRSVREAGFSPNACKLVVLLGDMGDKSDENDPLHSAEAAVVAELLPDNEAPLDFYALHVVAPDRLKHEAVKAFQTQMRTVVSRYREATEHAAKERKSIQHKASGQAVGQASYSLLSDANKVRDAIVTRFQGMQAEQRRILEQIDELERDPAPGTAIEPALEMRLGDEPLIDKLKETKGAQIFNTGYVWVRNGGPEQASILDAVRYELLFNEAELDEMIKLLNGLAKLSTQSGKTEPRDFVREVIKFMVNEKDVDCSFEEAVCKKLGLKSLSFGSKLLREKTQNIRDTTFNRDELRELAKKAMLLEDARNGAVNEYVLHEESIGRSGIPRRQWLRVGKPITKRRAFYLYSNELNRWYWLEKAMEWP